MSMDLSRYLMAHKNNYTVVYAQIMEKKYDSGWIEYVFPRYKKDCGSDKSKFYGLESLKEAQAFWKTKFLKRNYIEMLKAIDRMSKDEYFAVFSERGRSKIKISLDIFKELASDEEKEIINSFINKFYN